MIYCFISSPWRYHKFLSTAQDLHVHILWQVCVAFLAAVAAAAPEGTRDKRGFLHSFPSDYEPDFSHGSLILAPDEEPSVGYILSHGLLEESSPLSHNFGIDDGLSHGFGPEFSSDLRQRLLEYRLRNELSQHMRHKLNRAPSLPHRAPTTKLRSVVRVPKVNIQTVCSCK